MIQTTDSSVFETTVVLVVCLIVLVTPLATGSTNRVPIGIANIEELDRILDVLSHTSTFGEPERQSASAQLRDLGTNVFPLLLFQMHAIDQTERTNASAAMPSKLRIRAAFECLGPLAKPLTPELVHKLKAGRSPGEAAYGLCQIGPENGMVLVEAITNSIPSVRAAAADAITRFGNNARISTAAVNPLLDCLDDTSASLRTLVANSLGLLAKEPEKAIPKLLQKARQDPEAVVRIIAIKAVGRFGKIGAEERNQLLQISESDQDEQVRRIAAAVARSAERWERGQACTC